MAFESLKCLFCQCKGRVGFSIFGPIGKIEKALEIIEQHFWFDLKPTDSIDYYTCFDCWPKVKSFHEFYAMVKIIHGKEFIDRDYVELNETEDIDEHNSVTEDLSDRASHNGREKIIRLEIDFMNNGIENHTEDDSSSYEESSESSERLETSSVASSVRWNVSSDSEDNSNNGLQLPNGIKQNGEHKANNVGNEHLYLSQTSDLDESLAFSDNTNELSELNLNRKIGRPRKLNSNGTSTRKRRHIESMECFVCHNQFQNIDQLKKHLSQHELPCEFCFEKFSHRISLQQHMKTEHEQELNEKYDTNCTVCGIKLRRASLWAHMKRIHGDEKNRTFLCTICDKVFHSRANLSQHFVTHADINQTKVQCNICDKWTKNKHCLRVHKLTHMKNAEKCPYCDKVKHSIRALRAHIATSHEKPGHSCTICDKAFSRPHKLKEHIATHSGEALYNCLYCEKTFKCNSNMYKHMRECHTERWRLDQAMKSKLRASIYA